MEKVKWYTLAVCIWIFIFPITGITGWAFMISGPLAIVVGTIKFLLKIFGMAPTWLTGSDFNLGAFPEFVISLVTGVLLTLVGILLWKITKRINRWLTQSKPKDRPLDL